MKATSGSQSSKIKSMYANLSYFIVHMLFGKCVLINVALFFIFFSYLAFILPRGKYFLQCLFI